jgi:hypothetical protein
MVLSMEARLHTKSSLDLLTIIYMSHGIFLLA